MTTICSKCRSSLAADIRFCPQCGTPTSSYYSNSGASPYDLTAASSSSGAPLQAPPAATDYGSPPYGVPLQNPYEPLNPYEATLQAPPPPPPRRPVKMGLLIGIVVLVLVLVSGGIFAFLIQGTKGNTSRQTPMKTATPDQLSITATGTETPQGLYNQATSDNPVLTDPLNHQDSNNWDTFSSPQASCRFQADGYHITQTQQNTFQPCLGQATNSSNFAAQVEMTMLKGDGGGLLFRAGGAEPFGYRFALTRDYFDLIYGNHRLYTSSDIKTNLHQTYLLTVIARRSTTYLYRDKQWLATVADSSASSGIIGFIALKFDQNAEVVYRNLKVWTLS